MIHFLYWDSVDFWRIIPHEHVVFPSDWYDKESTKRMCRKCQRWYEPK